MRVPTMSRCDTSSYHSKKNPSKANISRTTDELDSKIAPLDKLHLNTSKKLKKRGWGGGTPRGIKLASTWFILPLRARAQLRPPLPNRYKALWQLCGCGIFGRYEEFREV